MFLEVLIALGLICWLIYHYFTRNYDFWEKRGVPNIPGVFPFGSLKDVVLSKVHIGAAYAEVYRKFPEERFCGVVELHRPILVVRDPDLIKQILIKDFNYFVDRAAFDNNPKESITNHLFLMEGESWRNMRHKLSPAFSSGKMKNMLLLMAKCSEQLADCLDKIVETENNVDVKVISAKFTMDIIATCAFGIEMNSLSDENTEFYKMGVSIFRPTTNMIIKQRIITLFPSLSQILNIERFRPNEKRMLGSLVSETVKYREQNNVCRKDFLDILIKLKHNESILDDGEEDGKTKNPAKAEQTEGLTLEQMTAQAFIFFAAGFETASSTMTFCLYELARHPEVQQRLWREVEEVLGRHGGEVTYQTLQELKYMDQVVNETLRMYASVSVLHRRCTQPYRLPGTDLVLDRGQKVYIPIYAIHHDPQYFPDPYTFDPERFTPDKIQARHPFVHLPFGDGPRNCIGMRFGLMQTKVGLITFLSRFRVEESPDTPVVIHAAPKSFVTLPDKPVYLKVTKR